MKNNTILIGTIICSIFTIHLDNSCGLSQAKIEDTCFNTEKAQQTQEREIKTTEAIINSQPTANFCLHDTTKEEDHKNLLL